ncbi:Lysine-specific demethylase 2B [Holothuria leucospilota]|uniref:[histone H3]-dimethyl-L-lysine(36) demethylase n=1 Tax=Holothuria leucospilota TaxID=206669 RepID=A0A9Q1HCE9_HOLLE|nr:Lysine-specific demethylase 2B [Holothuria leucospilota]
MATQNDTRRSMRSKARRHYDEGESQDDEIDGKRTYSLEDKLRTDKYNADLVKSMSGEEFTYRYIQEHGFVSPMVFKDSAGLGLRMPTKEFTVNDVKLYVGSRRLLDVMDVNTQKGVEMNMAQFAKYYENTDREKLLNVISLEFSHTRLDDLVQSPAVVKKLDWADLSWPQHLKWTQKDSTNVLAEMKYPKVQKYCLMSVGGCYTDFHVDFGGTSVWYHILHGKKVFWLIPPSEHNMQIYENWVLSSKQGDIFLGDKVSDCGKVYLEAGDSFLIPSGWIHAVYTPEDSLVFGGNFVHTFSVRKQLRVASIEDKTHVPTKFRYPFFTEIHWYTLERYVKILTGKGFMKEVEPPPHTSHRKAGGSHDGETDDDCATSVQVKDEDNGSATDEEKVEKMDMGEEGSSQGGEENNKELEVKHPTTVDEYDSQEDTDIETAECSYSKQGSSDSEDSEVQFNNIERREMDLKRDLGVEKMHNGDSESDEGNSKQEACNSPNAAVGPDGDGEVKAKQSATEPKYIHLCQKELQELSALVKFLDGLTEDKRNVPDLITDPDELLKEGKKILKVHANDNQELAMTGEPVLKWPERPSKKSNKAKGAHTIRPPVRGMPTGTRKRRTRCRKCENCMNSDCGECHFCKDMKKFGGPGRMKQSCISRQCLSPILPNTACCSICLQEERAPAELVTLMECHQCNEIVHPKCLKEKFEGEGVMNDELLNSWECPKCVAGVSSKNAEEGEPSGTGKKRKESSQDGADSKPKIVKKGKFQKARQLKLKKAGRLPAMGIKAKPSKNTEFHKNTHSCRSPVLMSFFYQQGKTAASWKNVLGAIFTLEHNVNQSMKLRQSVPPVLVQCTECTSSLHVFQHGYVNKPWHVTKLHGNLSLKSIGLGENFSTKKSGN